jgi:hypothetical protein
LDEGNVDLAENELRKEEWFRFQERTYSAQTEVLGGTGRMGYKRLMRQPMWKIYKKRGVAVRRWRRLILKVRLLREKIEKKSRGIGV